jgi:hypothetical protein
MVLYEVDAADLRSCCACLLAFFASLLTFTFQIGAVTVTKVLQMQKGGSWSPALNSRLGSPLASWVTALDIKAITEEIRAHH